MQLISIKKYPENIKIIFCSIKITININNSHRLFKLKKLFNILTARTLFTFNFFKGKSKKYPHIITFGKNCEIASMLSFVHGKVESTLFSWSSYDNKKDFLQTIKNPSNILSGEYTFNEDANTYKCHSTNMLFHGSKKPYELLDKNGKLDSELVEKEKQATIDKIKYLAQKNETIYQSKDRKLYAFTIDCTTVEDCEFIKNLYEYLSSKNPNFDMLVIVEKGKYCEELNNLEKELPNLFLREVCLFNQYMGIDIAMPIKYYFSWLKVFYEFVSTSQNAKKKKLKCD